jgi:acyl-CoA synthetase (AMP-forming)/AMP-acid ligase II
MVLAGPGRERVVVNTYAFLAKATRQRPEARAVRFGDDVLTYEELHARTLAIGGNLRRLGLVPGDRVGFVLANSPRILETIYGCFAAGLIVVPINARLHPKEIAYIIANSGAKVLIHGPEYDAGIVRLAEDFTGLTHRFVAGGEGSAESYESLLDTDGALSRHDDADPEDPCWLFYTSGTTGRPKGATWTHRVVRAMLMNYLADVHNIQPGEVVLHAAPLSHGSGIVALPAVARGADQIIMTTGSFDPAALFQTIQDEQVSHIAFLAPTQIVRMLEEFVPGSYDLSSLKAICYGGAPIYVEHLRRAVETFGPVFAQIFGQGEAPITITGLSPRAHADLLAAGDERIGSAGTIRTDVEAHAVDEEDNELPPREPGEIVVRGDVVMKGYWNDPDATAAAIRNGWLHTGDIGAFDEQGYLFLLDRAKDMIISGGNNVYPREVEEVIVTHPAVANVVVIGVPDTYWGEAVHAVVVREPGAELTSQDIIAHCAESLAGYKKPKAVDFVDELPVSGYGKVLRREVRERYWVGQERRVGGGVGKPLTPSQ